MLFYCSLGAQAGGDKGNNANTRQKPRPGEPLDFGLEITSNDMIKCYVGGRQYRDEQVPQPTIHFPGQCVSLSFVSLDVF